MIAKHQTASGTIAIEATQRYRTVELQFSHLELTQRHQHWVRPGAAYHIDLCITPRLSSRMRFDRWVPNRFERLGRLFVVPPGEALAVWNDLGRESILMCSISADAINRWLEGPIASDGDPIEASANITSEPIESLMLRLCQEVRAPGLAANVMIEAYAMQLAVELERHYRAMPLPSQSGGLAPWRMRRIEDRLRSSDEPASLAELASLCDLSIRQLSRSFQECRGMSIGHYVTHLRIERSKSLLMLDSSVKSVAAQLHFSSTAAFCCAFRRATGLTPSEFRRLGS